MSENEKIFHTIGEVSRSVDVAQHVLRFWEEKFSQIKPIKRRGRRLYNKSDIELIKKIKHLLYEKGYTMKGVQREINGLDELKAESDNCQSDAEIEELIEICGELSLIQQDLMKILEAVDGA